MQCVILLNVLKHNEVALFAEESKEFFTRVMTTMSQWPPFQIKILKPKEKSMISGIVRFEQ